MTLGWEDLFPRCQETMAEDDAIENYVESLDTLAHSCGDDEDADEIAEMEAVELKRAARRGKFTEFEAVDGSEKASYVTRRVSLDLVRKCLI